jgi:hypothetical protein
MQNYQTPSGGPRQNYLNHLEERRAALILRERRNTTFGNLRAIVFFTAVAMTFAVFASHMLSAWSLLVPIVAFLWLGVCLQHVENERSNLSRAWPFMIKPWLGWMVNGPESAKPENAS